jgi:trans-aconitate methyltransferase
MNEKNHGHFTWNAEDYADHSTAQYTWAREMIGRLGLRGSESVLDVGCGDGKVTALIASSLPGGTVTGIDSSASMIALAEKKFPQSAYPNISFLQADATRLSFTNRFDLAFSNAALHWIPDQASVLGGVSAALKPSGRIFFQMGGRGNAKDILECANRQIREERWRPYFTGFSLPLTFYSPEEYEVLLRAAGFIPKRLELIHKDMTQKGREDYAGWIRTTWLWLTDRIPEHEREIFVSELIDAYLQEFPEDAEGLIHTRMVRLEVEAVKG